MFLKRFCEKIHPELRISGIHRFFKPLLVAFLSTILASCILGSSDRSSDSGGDDTDRNSDSALDPPVKRESGDDIFTTTTALHTFKQYSLVDNPEVIDDDIEFFIESFPRPEETDDVDNNRDDENVITAVTESWTDIKKSWDGGPALPGTQTKYLTLSASSGWSDIKEKSDKPFLYMIDGEIRESVLGVTYEWVALKESQIPKVVLSDGQEATLDIAGLDMPDYPVWLEFLFGLIPAKANYDNPVDSLRWMTGEGFDPDADLFGDTVEDLEFDPEAMVYVVSRYVLNTVYSIEQVSADEKRTWPIHDVGISNLLAFAQMFDPTATGSVTPITDFTDLQYGLYKNGAVHMGFYFQFQDTALDCLEDGDQTTKSVGEFYLAYENKDGQGLQARSLTPKTITRECIGDNTVFVLEMTAYEKIDAGLGGYYDLFLAEADKISTTTEPTFYFGKRYNETVIDPVTSGTIPPLLLYNDKAATDIKNAIKAWRDRDYFEAL